MKQTLIGSPDYFIRRLLIGVLSCFLMIPDASIALMEGLKPWDFLFFHYVRTFTGVWSKALRKLIKSDQACILVYFRKNLNVYS